MAKPDVGDNLQHAGDRVRDAAGDAAQEGWRGLQPLLDFKLLHIAGLDLTVGGLVAAVLALAAAWFASSLVRRALTHYAERNAHANRAALYTLARMVHYVLLLLGALLALDLAGIPVGKFAVFAGALGVGLGFGLQAIFSNFISGLILLFDRSLKVGDFVELASGVHGEVRDIKIRATRIVTNDNIDILVPNAEFVTGRVVNWTYREVSRRVRIPFGVAYGSDKELVKKAALEAAAEVRFTLTLEGARGPRVWLVNFGASSLDFELVVWLNAEATKRPSAVRAAYTWALHTALAKYAIEIPFPQQDLHVRSLFGRHGDEALALLRSVASIDAEIFAERFGPQRAAGLSGQERAALASNDAQQDVEEHRQVEREIAREKQSQPRGSDRDAPPDEAAPGESAEDAAVMKPDNVPRSER
jgi:small-conductance mechanosensitive channel